MSEFALQFRDLSGGYGDTRIIHALSGGVASGAVLGVFGRNGVGKTTLAKLLGGELALQSGSVSLHGAPVEKLSPHKRRFAGLGMMPQTYMVFDQLTVRENLTLANADRPWSPLLEIFPRLAERLDQKAGSMSGGERKILSFARTMLEDTSIIILDEPSEGVQPENIQHMQACIAQRRAQGCAIVLIEQNLTMLLATCDAYLGLDSGRAVFRKTAASCTRDDLLAVLAI